MSSNNLQNQSTNQMRETILATAAGGMAIALSSVLSLVKLFAMPQGGSVTAASMLPILFVALAFGPAWGMGVGAVYGLLQFVIEPYSAHWASVILDYPLAFGLLGLAGFFAVPKADRLEERQILRRLGGIRWPMVIVAVLTGMFGRTISHVLSGIVFYASYAGDQNPLIYSLVYNLSYMVP
ncbi:MAG: energy-coupled thiamine transporter ThiT, partial [Eubacteriales bacterium]|nr:energy-coupled thiamine transporter ThiT [Eubacteriales bacterium]